MDRSTAGPTHNQQRALTGLRHLTKRLLGHPTSPREDIDSQARWMGRGSHLAPLSATAAHATAQRLGVHFPTDVPMPGISIGRSVVDNTDLFGSYEDLHVDIWGPRQGKTSCRVIPAVLEAPGTVLVTSTKTDVLDTTVDSRADMGQVWVFDPQHMTRACPQWSWDPLSYVIPPHQRNSSHPPTGAVMRAEKLAAHFADSTRTHNAQSDEFFDAEAHELLTGLFLAAALSQRPISAVWQWVTAPHNAEPGKILDTAGYRAVAEGIYTQYHYSPDQRSGVFGTAKKMVRCLKDPELLAWIEPEAHRRSFDPYEFIAQSCSTLYLLSTGEIGSASVIVNALTEAVLEAATHLATRYGGRLPTPLMAILDEAANIVRWRQLPTLYSHFGSRGIVIMTILQSWSQGVACWGEAGMAALWSAANIRVLGSGVSDTAFLRDRTEDIGSHYEITESVTYTPGQSERSITRARTEVPTMTISDLVSLPKGRMIIFATGLPPVLAVGIPFWQRFDAPTPRTSDSPALPQSYAPTAHELVSHT